MKEFGNRLRKTMIDKNMTGFELSQKLEVTPSMISNYISGRRFPGFYSLKKLALALDVSIDYLLGLSEEKTIELSGDTLKEEHDISEEEAKLRFIFDCLTEGDYKKAKEAYDSLNAYKLKGMALYETALLSLLMQKEKKAIELLERFNSFNLQESCGLSKLGDIYRACGDLERAKDYYTKALKRNEKDSKATENLGEIAIFKGDYTEAYFWYDKLARDYPLEAKAYLRIGEILRELGRSPAARRNFLAGVILNACSSKPLEIATDTFHEVLGEEIKTEELIEAIEAVRRNGDRERNANGQELDQRREARGERFEERRDFGFHTSNLIPHTSVPPHTSSQTVDPSLESETKRRSPSTVRRPPRREFQDLSGYSDADLRSSIPIPHTSDQRGDWRLFQDFVHRPANPVPCLVLITALSGDDLNE